MKESLYFQRKTWTMRRQLLPHSFYELKKQDKNLPLARPALNQRATSFRFEQLYLYELNLIESYFTSLDVNEEALEQTNKQKTILFMFPKHRSVLLLEVKKFPRGALSINSIPNAYNTSQLKIFIPYECFDNAKKPLNQPLPSYHDFFSRSHFATCQ